MTVIVGELCAGNGQLSTVEIRAAAKGVRSSSPIIVDLTAAKRCLTFFHERNAGAFITSVRFDRTMINIQGILATTAGFGGQVNTAAITAAVAMHTVTINGACSGGTGLGQHLEPGAALNGDTTATTGMIALNLTGIDIHLRAGNDRNAAAMLTDFVGIAGARLGCSIVYIHLTAVQIHGRVIGYTDAATDVSKIICHRTVGEDHAPGRSQSRRILQRLVSDCRRIATVRQGDAAAILCSVIRDDAIGELHGRAVDGDAAAGGIRRIVGHGAALHLNSAFDKDSDAAAVAGVLTCSGSGGRRGCLVALVRCATDLCGKTGCV